VQVRNKFDQLSYIIVQFSAIEWILDDEEYLSASFQLPSMEVNISNSGFAFCR
jgi:hypothetical protein